MRKDEAYWHRRILADKARAVNNAEKYLQGQQKRLYGQAEKEIQQEIERLYEKFADQQEITLAEAKKRIREADFKKIDWDGMIQESLRLRKELERADLPDEVRQILEKQHRELEDQIAALSKRGQISYLELRRLEIDRILMRLYDSQQQDIYDYLASEYDDGYYRQVFNTQQHVGFGKDFIHPNEAAVDKVLLNPYKRKNFSHTLYAHCKTFSKDLRNNLAVGLIRGESVDKMVRRISGRLEVSRSAARRLVRTETAYVYEQAAKDAYAACDIEYYEYLAALDNRTSEMCRELDGQHFPVKDAQPGKNYPPMHPNCRSTTVCWFPDEEEKKGRTTRLAKDEDGTYYDVPADMTYKEWSQDHRENMKDVKKVAELIFDEVTDLKEPVPLSKIPYGKTIRKQVENNPSPVAKLLLKHYDEIKFINLNPKGYEGFYNNKNKVGIRLNVNRKEKSLYGEFQPVYHEIGHYLDYLLGDASHTQGFEELLKQEAEDIFSYYTQTYGEDKGYRELEKICNRQAEYHSVGDILTGTNPEKFRARHGHNERYWKTRPGRLAEEAFAHFVEAELSGNEEKREAVKSCFPESYLKFMEAIENGVQTA